MSLNPDVENIESVNDIENNSDVPVNVPVNDQQQWFTEQLVAGINLKAADIAEHFTVTTMTAKRDIAKLKERGVIEFVGPPKTGRYRLK